MTVIGVFTKASRYSVVKNMLMAAVGFIIIKRTKSILQPPSWEKFTAKQQGSQVVCRTSAGTRERGFPTIKMFSACREPRATAVMRRAE
jgi:hypothetical protein